MDELEGHGCGQRAREGALSKPYQTVQREESAGRWSTCQERNDCWRSCHTDPTHAACLLSLPFAALRCTPPSRSLMRSLGYDEVV